MSISKSLTAFAASFLACLSFYLNLAFSQEAPASVSAEKIPDEVYARAAQAVVKISAGDEQVGAGLVIGKTRNGLPVILTANALIAGNENEIMIQPAAQAQAAPGRLITDKWRNRDLVLIAARQPLPVAAALPYGSSDQLTPGEDIVVLGFPQANSLAENSGQVVRNEASQILLNFIITEGQRGGPVLDKKGRVIGLATSRPGELCQAIPVDLARVAVEQWLSKTQLMEPWQEEQTEKNWQGWLVAAGLLIATGVAVGVSGVF